jgi:hypothetical protein
VTLQKIRFGLIYLALALVSITAACSRGKSDEDHRANTVGHASERLSRDSAGEPILRLDSATQTRIGLRTQLLTSQSMRPEIVAYGRLEEDPSRSFVLRAPISGILHYAPGRDWPSMGARLADGAVIGIIEPRLTPAERIGLSNQLATAQSELKATTASASAAQAAYERARILNADNKNISDRVLQDAAARLQAEEARLHAATETVKQLQRSLQSSDPAGTRRLAVERGGEVVELIAQPGEAIEPGSPILRVAKLNQLLARVDIPVGEHIPPSVASARIVPVGFENRPVLARRIAIAIPTATSLPGHPQQAQGEAFLFRLTEFRFGLRPGVAVTAYIDVPGPLQAGVIVPQSAIVRAQGLGFAYVQTAPDQFVRKQISLGHLATRGYFTTDNFQPGDRVVVVGSQSLLSEEFKSQVSDID